MKTNFFRILMLLAVLLAAGVKSHAERGDTLVNPYFELLHIIATLGNNSYYYVDTFTFDDYVDSSGHHTHDSLQITYLMQGEKYQAAYDSTELMQDDLYNVRV